MKNNKKKKITFIVLISPRQGILIPKKGFTKDELEDIRKCLKK